MPYCNNCGHQNPEGSNFCSNCGHRLDAPVESRLQAVGETTKVIPIMGDETGPRRKLSEEEQRAVDALPAGKGLLIVHRGPAAGNRFLLDGPEDSAGRHPDSDIFLDDITVSRHHSVFRRGSTGQFVVEDNGSLNGTYVNRALIDGEVALKTGDEVQIGKFRMMFFAGTDQD